MQPLRRGTRGGGGARGAGALSAVVLPGLAAILPELPAVLAQLLAVARDLAARDPDELRDQHPLAIELGRGRAAVQGRELRRDRAAPARRGRLDRHVPAVVAEVVPFIPQVASIASGLGTVAPAQIARDLAPLGAQLAPVAPDLGLAPCDLDPGLGPLGRELGPERVIDEEEPRRVSRRASVVEPGEQSLEAGEVAGVVTQRASILAELALVLAPLRPIAQGPARSGDLRQRGEDYGG